jgi:hypothetical protein
MSVEPLHRLHPASLQALAGALREGPLAAGLSVRALGQIAGPHAEDVEVCLRGLLDSGMTPAHVALVVDAVAETRERALDPSLLIDLILSGPDVPGIPTGDTAAAMHTLVEAAETEILLVGYAVHNGEKLFSRLAERMREAPSLRVVFCLDISRPWQDTSLSSEIVRRFVHDFKTRHWPWPELPELYYDARSLDTGHEQRSCLHAKCVVINRSEALVTSANFTEAAQERNIEVGVRVRYGTLARRLAAYFLGLIEARALLPCDLSD